MPSQASPAFAGKWQDRRSDWVPIFGSESVAAVELDVEKADGHFCVGVLFGKPALSEELDPVHLVNEKKALLLRGSASVPSDEVVPETAGDSENDKDLRCDTGDRIGASDVLHALTDAANPIMLMRIVVLTSKHALLHQL